MSSLWIQLWALSRGFRARYLLAQGALLIAAALAYLVPLIPQIVIDGVLAEDPSRSAGFVAKIVEAAGGAEHLRDHLELAVVALLALAVAIGACHFFQGRWTAQASEGIVARLRNRMYDHLQRLPASTYDRWQTGDLVQRCTSDIETFRQFLTLQAIELGRAGFLLLAPLPWMFALDATMTWVSLAAVPLIGLFGFLFFRRIRGTFEGVDEAEGEMTHRLQENLTNIRVVRAFSRQDHEIERFGRANAVHRRCESKLYGDLARFWSISDTLCLAQMASVLAVGAHRLSAGQLLVGELYFFLAAVALFQWPLRMSGRILAEFGKATIAIGRLGEVLAEPREPVLAGNQSAPGRGDLELEDVSFAYDDEPVLHGVSVRLRPGETLGVLGPSGSGKSSLVQLLLRFRDPTSGRILLDGRDLASLDPRAIRRRVAAVLQDPFLYSKTIGENIRLGRAEATQEEIEQAADTAGIHHDILELEHGYETLVGERGVTLSGGQRQRVALARALVDRPALLILDDALSAVDARTESTILSRLRERRDDCTTVLISHRLATLRHADQIIVLEGGRITQRGTHPELVSRPGLYARLWSWQTGASDAAVHASATRGGER